MWLSDLIQKLTYTDAIIESYTGDILFRYKQDEVVRKEFSDYLVDSITTKTSYYGDNGMESYPDGVLFIRVYKGRS